MSEDTYWVKWVGIVLCCLIVSLTVGCVISDYIEVEAIKSGADVMALSCRRVEAGKAPTCVLWASHLGDKK